MAIRKRLRSQPSKIDWLRILLGLRRYGFTAESLAERLDIGDPSTVRKWGNDGVCPRYDAGAALIELYEATVGQAAPRRPT